MANKPHRVSVTITLPLGPEVSATAELSQELVDWATHRAIADGRPGHVEDYLMEYLGLSVNFEFDVDTNEAKMRAPQR